MAWAEKRKKDNGFLLFSVACIFGVMALFQLLAINVVDLCNEETLIIKVLDCFKALRGNHISKLLRRCCKIMFILIHQMFLSYSKEME